MTDAILPRFIEIPANKRSIWMRKSIYGIGKNDAEYMVYNKINGKNTKCPFYIMWHHMIERCYCSKALIKRPAYKDCTVIKEWLTFSNFKVWMINQDWKGKQLDKDVLVVGNKVYGHKTCIFVSPEVNMLLTQNKSNAGKFPLGVFIDKRAKNIYRGSCCIMGKSKNLGNFSTPEEAHEAYKIAKSNEINRMALLQDDIRIKNGLIKHAEHLLNG